MSDPRIRTLRQYLQGEVDAAYLYTSLAASEADRNLGDVFRRLAERESRHADFWRVRLLRAGASDADATPRWSARLLASTANKFGSATILPYLARIEAIESHGYDGEPDAIAAGMPADEYGHARIVQAAALEVGGLPGTTLAMVEGRRRGGNGNALRAAVLGANDGLVSNLSLVMGVAGATADEHTVLLTGLAGLVAGACSMAMGEWLSVSSAPEMATAARSSGSIRPTRAGAPWSAAAASFGLFALGAIFPVVPVFALTGAAPFVASFVLSALALSVIGAATSPFTVRSLLISTSRQLVIGLAAALVSPGPVARSA